MPWKADGRGDPPAEDGARIHVDVPMPQRTANYHQLARGLAYPTFYRRLYPDLRAVSEIPHWPGCGTISPSATTGCS